MSTLTRTHIVQLALAALALLTIVSFSRAIFRYNTETGGYDLHPYWYYAHFLYQGENPYQAYAEDLQLALPIHYWDGTTVTDYPVEQTGLAAHPANTAPILLLLSPLARFSWPVAKWLMLAFNLVCIAAIPWLVLRLLPDDFALPRAEQWLVAVIFYSMKAPRVVAYNGQLSLVIVALMLLALVLRKRHWFWSGLLLGISLSKYSLTLPALIFLLFERRWAMILVALAVQAAGVLAVSLFGSYSALDVIRVYVEMVLLHAGMDSIHLGYLFRSVPLLANAVLAVGTLFVAWWLWRWWATSLPPSLPGSSVAFPAGSPQRMISPYAVLPLLTVLCLWMLLVVYHRNYDTHFAILFVALVMAVLHRNRLSPRYSQRMVAGLTLFLVFSVGVMSLPGDILRVFLPDEWGDLWLVLVDRMITLTLVGMLGVSMWLLEAETRREGEAQRDAGTQREPELAATGNTTGQPEITQTPLSYELSESESKYLLQVPT